jgi:hypothetical protein
MTTDARAAQEALCARVGVALDFVDGQEKLGAARSLFGQSWPIKGLRYLRADDTCGWYLWAGEYSDSPDFFQPQHARHIFEARPEAIAYLGLPSGWGFVIAPGYDDLWLQRLDH